MQLPVEEPVRVAVVGCGAVAERYHLPAILECAGVEAVAFVDPEIERARALAARAGASLAVASHTELFGEVDLAIVTAPNALHERLSVDLLNAGVHVLVEKPMARTAAECVSMIAAAERTGSVLAIGHDFRHFPVAQFARAFFAAELLGEIRSVDVEQSAGSRWPSVSPEVLSPASGGGSFITFGVHIVDLLCWWLGDLEVLTYRDDAAGGVEAECECALALTNGAPVSMKLSRLRGLRDTTIVEGERGTVEIGIHEPALFRLSFPGGGPLLSGTVPDGEIERAPLRTVFRRQLADVVGAIRERRSPLVDGAQGMRAVAVVENCYSIRETLRRPWDYPEAYQSVGRVRS